MKWLNEGLDVDGSLSLVKAYKGWAALIEGYIGTSAQIIISNESFSFSNSCYS